MKETIELKFFRLVTGEDLITQVVRKGEIYVLIQPLKIAYMAHAAGKISISLYQWVFSRISDAQEFPIFPTDIITMSNPSVHMTKHYWEMINHYNKNSYVVASGDATSSSEEESFGDLFEEEDNEEDEEDLIYRNQEEVIKEIKKKLH